MNRIEVAAVDPRPCTSCAQQSNALRVASTRTESQE